MKALLTADTLGGVWTYALDLARGLAPWGVEIVLAALGAPLSESQRWQLRSLDNVTLHESSFKLEWMDEPWDDVQRSGEWLLAIEQSFKPDVVHLNGYAHGCLPFAAPRLVAGHSCVLSWWEACRGQPAPPQWDRYRQEVRNGLASADLVVAPSGAMLAQLQRYYGPLENCRVIPNGRQGERFCGSRAKESFVLTAGRLWDEAKNVAAVDAVAARINWPVYVAGDDRRPDGCRAATFNALMLGKLDELTLADFYARASIYALPARYEPFGLSILEAAFSGCALVLGDIPSLRENWDGAAEFVSPGDVDELHRAIQHLIDNRARRSELASIACARARRFTIGACAWAYLNAYQHLIGTRTNHPFTRSTLACAS